MKEKTGSFGFAAATIMLVLVAALSFAGTAMCRTKGDGAGAERNYREKEAQLVKSTRAYLDYSGFDNSGVMLTRVVDGSGSRRYTVTIHHREIDRLEEAERENLARELSAFAFEDEGITFCYKFLLSD